MTKEEEIKQRIEIENISPETLFSEKVLIEYARGIPLTDIWDDRELKGMIFDYLWENL